MIALDFAEPGGALTGRIDARVDAMAAAGLFGEVRSLLARGLDAVLHGHAGHRLQGGGGLAVRGELISQRRPWS